MSIFPLPRGYEPVVGFKAFNITALKYKNDAEGPWKTIDIFICDEKVDLDALQESALRECDLQHYGKPTYVAYQKSSNGIYFRLTTEPMIYKNGKTYMVTHTAFDTMDDKTVTLLHVVPETIWPLGGEKRRWH